MAHTDTDARAREVQLQVYRSMSPDRRFAIAVDMSQEVRRIAYEQIRLRHPEYSELEARRALLGLLYGDELASRVPLEHAKFPQ